MTPELALSIIEKGYSPELQKLYPILKECYRAYTGNEIAEVFAYIRAEIVLSQMDPSTIVQIPDKPKRKTRKKTEEPETS